MKEVQCGAIREGKLNGKPCAVVIAFKDEEVGSYAGFTDPSYLEMVKKKLATMNIALGGPMPKQQPAKKTSFHPPLLITGKDRENKTKTAIADDIEEFSLSSGSKLFYLYLFAKVEDLAWMIGQNLELTESLAGNGGPLKSESLAIGNQSTG